MSSFYKVMKYYQQSQFARDILVVLLVKFILIMSLWYFFFRHPVTINEYNVEQRILPEVIKKE